MVVVPIPAQGPDKAEGQKPSSENFHLVFTWLSIALIGLGLALLAAAAL